MRNADVARVMEEIGGLMRFRGDNPFKIRAYENAAQAIRELDEPLVTLLAEGRLRSIPGIGAAIEKKIADYARTGSVPTISFICAARCQLRTASTASAISTATTAYGSLR